jgi:tRNA threonylcarbamoyladenosine biosynthesis protein TsaE
VNISEAGNNRRYLCSPWELGSGKTQLVKGIARGIGVVDWEYVVSPSFTIMNIYEGNLRLCHVDLYRIEGTEMDDLNLEEFLQKGIVVVEWAKEVSGE